MAARGGGVALLAGAWAASALFAGWLLAPWFAVREGLSPAPDVSTPEPRDGTGGTAPEPHGAERAIHNAPPATGAATTETTAGERGSGPGGGTVLAQAHAATVHAIQLGSAITRLEVTATHSDGSPVPDGLVYVLPASSPGADKEDELVRGHLDQAGRVTLDVPAGAQVDVGLLCSGGPVMRTGVVVGWGLPTRVHLALPPMGTVRLKAELPLAPVDGVEPVTRVTFLPPEPEGDTRAYPGRHERGEVWGGTAELDRGGHGTSTPLLEGLEYRVFVVIEWPTRGSREPPAAPFDLVPDRMVVKPGETLVLHRRRLAQLSLLAQVSGTPPGRGGQAWAFFYPGEQSPLASRLLLFAGSHAQLTDVSASASEPLQGGVRVRGPAAQPAPIRWPVVRSVPPGPGRVEWGGLVGMVPGSLDVALEPGERREITVPIHFDASTRTEDTTAAKAPVAPAPTMDVEVLVEGPDPDPDDLPIGVALYLGAAGSAASGEPDFAGWEPNAVGRFRWTVEPSRRSSAPVAVATQGDRWASDPFDPRSGDALRIRLRPAGTLLVVPGAIDCDSDDGPRLRLERLDGAPLPTRAPLDRAPFRWNERDSERAGVAVRTGTIIGPFPAGVMRFRVKRGGFVLGEVSAEVVAGQIRPLLLAR